MDVIHSTLKWKFAFVHFDKTEIIFRSPQEHISLIRNLVTLLRSARVTLKEKKCWLFTNTVEYLGHVIRPSYLEIAESTKKPSVDYKTPTNFTENQSFLELCNIFDD